MERKIGETFEFEGKKLLVKEVACVSCDGCFFDGKCFFIEKVGECEAVSRTDRKEVVFVDVREQQQEQTAQPQEQTEQQTEQPQKLNLCEILKYCPQGETFWSPMLDGVKFLFIDERRQMIMVETIEGHFTWEINADATISIDEVTSPEIMLYPSKEQRDWSTVHFETPVEKLPKSWQEFCETHEVQRGEAYIKDISTVYEADNTGDTRDMNADKNILPNEIACYQHLALMQLHQLRDCWRDGWKPEPYKTIWGITKDRRGDIELNSFDTVSVFLSFQDKERAEKFLECFRDLIEAAGDLI